MKTVPRQTFNLASGFSRDQPGGIQLGITSRDATGVATVAPDRPSGLTEPIQSGWKSSSILLRLAGPYRP
jgi:hypothetical protein